MPQQERAASAYRMQHTVIRPCGPVKRPQDKSEEARFGVRAIGLASFAKKEIWASTGLTDIHHQGHSPGKDVQNGDMERKKQRPRRSFTPEFKAEIVELCRRGDRTSARWPGTSI